MCFHRRDKLRSATMHTQAAYTCHTTTNPLQAHKAAVHARGNTKLVHATPPASGAMGTRGAAANSTPAWALAALHTAATTSSLGWNNVPSSSLLAVIHYDVPQGHGTAATLRHSRTVRQQARKPATC